MNTVITVKIDRRFLALCSFQKQSRRYVRVCSKTWICLKWIYIWDGNWAVKNKWRRMNDCIMSMLPGNGNIFSKFKLSDRSTAPVSLGGTVMSISYATLFAFLWMEAASSNECKEYAKQETSYMCIKLKKTPFKLTTTMSLMLRKAQMTVARQYSTGHY